MRSVRCDACGTKALMAASSCPKCGHGFQVRDGFGEMLPLSHCASCDSYYPQTVGSCKWCGTKPERAPIGPYMWKGAGIVAFVSLAIGAWLAKNDTPSSKSPMRTFVADTLPTNQPQAESFGRKVVVVQRDSASVAFTDSTASLTTPDSTRETSVAVATTDPTQPTPTSVVPAEPVSMQSAGAVAQTDSLPATDSPPADPPPAPVPTTRVVTPPRATPRLLDRTPARVAEKAPSRVLARAPERAGPRTVARPPARSTATAPARVIAKTPARVAPAPKSAARSKSSGRWVTSVARNWAVVRSDPTRQSRIVAAIGPNTRVQLGETRGAWRRIKAKGLAGWVEHRTLVARAVLPRRTGRLAAR